MKSKLSIMGLALLLSVLALLTFAAPEASGQSANIWSGAATNASATLNWVIVPAKSGNNGIPLVTYLTVTSDKAGSFFQSYLVTTNTTANYVSTTTSLPVAATNGFASGDVIIIRHIQEPELYEKRILTTFTSGTNLTVTVAPLQALASGDMVYRATTTAAAKIPCGNATLTLNSVGGIFAGQRFNGQPVPLLLELDSTSAGSVNAVTAVYQPTF